MFNVSCIFKPVRQSKRQSKGRQVKSCMNCPDRNNNVDSCLTKTQTVKAK